jgi:hypothetical protein
LGSDEVSRIGGVGTAILFVHDLRVGGRVRPSSPRGRSMGLLVSGAGRLGRQVWATTSPIALRPATALRTRTVLSA